MKELDRENEILMNSKECQTIPQTSDASMQRCFYKGARRVERKAVENKIVNH